MAVNLLAGEPSPYLRQHADNPVGWYPWGSEALLRAREEDLPIFLSIGYSTCHWCHVMAHESFEDADVADLLNRHFVPVKVDREERPDIDSVYMTVCQLMTGHGGWPLTAILTPDLEPFFVTTYVPRETRAGRLGMLDLLPRIHDAWRSRRSEVDRSASELVVALEMATRVPPGSSPGSEVLDAARAMLVASYDDRFGGFSSAPKFPTTHNLTFLLREWERTGDGGLLDMVTATLEGMARGGIRDQLGGGFHRYSTDREWRLPHFEKMLYDQALISLACLDAWAATGTPGLARVVRSTLDYVLNELRDRNGALHSAEDADSDGMEGRYYIWTESELAAALPDEADLLLAIDAYGVEPEGNYRDEATGRRSGFNVLLGAAVPAELAVGHGGSEREVEARLDDIRHRLLRARAARNRPGRDDKILTDWNGLAIAALARAGARLAEPRYVEAATDTARFLLDHLVTEDGRLMHRFGDGAAGIPAMASDYVSLAWGLLELYEAEFDPRWLETAAGLADHLVAGFASAEGALFATTASDQSPLVRLVETSDGALPSANSIAASVFLRLADLTGEVRFQSSADHLLDAVGGRVEAAPVAHTFMLQALDRRDRGSLQVVLAGARRDQSLERMLAVTREGFRPRLSVLVKPVDDPEACETLARLAPFTATMDARERDAAAYVCRGHECQAPVFDAPALEEALRV